MSHMQDAWRKPEEIGGTLCGRAHSRCRPRHADEELFYFSCIHAISIQISAGRPRVRLSPPRGRQLPTWTCKGQKNIHIVDFNDQVITVISTLKGTRHISTSTTQASIWKSCRGCVQALTRKDGRLFEKLCERPGAMTSLVQPPPKQVCGFLQKSEKVSLFLLPKNSIVRTGCLKFHVLRDLNSLGQMQAQKPLLRKKT